MKRENHKVRKFAVILTAAALTIGASMPMLNSSTVSSAVLSACAAEDEPYTDGSNDTFYYMKYSDHIAISGLKSTPNDLVIPDTIDGLPVTKIQLYTFQYLSISSVKFPDSLKEIDSYCFSDCPNLTEVTLPASIERLGFHVFENCTSLTTVNFPDHPVKASDFTFENTPWLTEQRKQNPLVIVNNSVIDARTTEGDVVIPTGVKYVAGGAFSKNEKVTSVVFPSSVSEIADSTFWMCSNLKSVSAPGAENIGTTAFGYCEKLSELKLSKKLKSIQPYCFTDCSNGGTITFYGTENDWNNVEILDTENFLKNSKFIFENNYVEEILGDVNMDGALNMADAVLLHKWLLTIPGTELKNWKAADLDQNGQLTSSDLTLMKKMILKG